MQRIAVTGATGFLGEAVIAALKRKGWPVTAVSRRLGEGLHSVNDYADCPVSDVIVHLGEESNRHKANRLGEDHAKRSTETVYALCRRAARVVYASSGVVYGDTPSAPFDTDDGVHATDFYSASKLRNEQTVLAAGGVALRLTNLYGARMSKENVLSDIAKQIPGQGPLTIRDDTPVRDFLHITDAAEAVCRAAERTWSGVLNVGSGEGWSIRAIALLALQVAGEEDREIVTTARSLKPSCNVLNILRIRRELAWAPTRPASTALRTFFQTGA